MAVTESGPAGRGADDAGGGAGSGGAGAAGPAAGGAPGDSYGPSDPLLAKRQELIQFLWGSDGFPIASLPTSIETDVASPVSRLGNLERVDTLHLTMDAGVESLAHHFIPANSKQNRLVILHHGHDVTFDDALDDEHAGYGLQRAISGLLAAGYSVLAVYMPGCLPPARVCGPHGDIVATKTTGSGMKFFLEPVAVYLNYLSARSQADRFPAYLDISMVGLSGGAWTTTLYAALDPRIRFSVAVAGSLPLALRGWFSWGDEEQRHAAFYEIAGYVDLYVLGGYGNGRRAIQVLNRYDDCCFGENPLEFTPPRAGVSFDEAVREYETEARERLAGLNAGTFRLEIDDLAPSHMISGETLATIIMGGLAVDGPVAPDDMGDRSQPNDPGAASVP